MTRNCACCGVHPSSLKLKTLNLKHKTGEKFLDMHFVRPAIITHNAQ